MNNLVGKMFCLAQGRYRIVDVRRLSGDAMVYAERVEAGAAVDAPLAPSGSPRAAFHYDDIAALLEAPGAP